MQYRKKPVIVEAVLYTGKNIEEVMALENVSSETSVSLRPADNVCLVRTLEGTMEAQPGDFIIKGVKGELYPCKPDIFEASYELVPAPAPAEV